MELGKRLKEARQELGISQRQLCGEKITRNMLSQIENGSATPSMATLSYLAGQLGKPVSYFLEGQTPVSPNQPVMEQARQAYARESYSEALALLEDYQGPDDLFDPERYLIEALSLISFARQVRLQGKTVYAQTLLQRAKQAGEHTLYYTEDLERRRILEQYLTQPEQAGQLAKQLNYDDTQQFLLAQVAMESGEYTRAAAILDGMPGENPRWQYLRGQAALKMEDYSLAVEHFLVAEDAYPTACAKALEQCYRELEDYKQAYFYACKLRQHT